MQVKKEIHEPEPFARTRAFFKGLVSGRPLHEVSLAVLRDIGLPQEKQHEHVRKLSAGLTPEDAYEALRYGMIECPKAEEALSEAAVRSSQPDLMAGLLVSGRIRSHRSQEMLAGRLLQLSRSGDRDACGFSAYLILMVGRVGSPAAEESLARIILENGLGGRACELLTSRNEYSVGAQHILAEAIPGDLALMHRIILRGRIASEIARKLCVSMPRICVPIGEDAGG
ncbi:MAG: hypothetical protein U0R44_01360 [Candidatus Micrarchaeia archaeon]